MPHSPTELDYVSPNWNNPSWWDDFYSSKIEDWEAKSYRQRDGSHLIEVIGKLKLEPPLWILDAGTGISYLAELAAYLGHKVVCTDISSFAIETCKNRIVTPSELAGCLNRYYNLLYHNKQEQYIDRVTGKAADPWEKLVALHRPGGEILAYEVMDWNDPQLLQKYGQFNLVLNENGFRNASNEFILKSLHSFYRLLKPGGVMIESNFNLIDRLKTIEGMVEVAGFHRLDEWHFYPGSDTDLSPVINLTDKFAVCCWPTG